jgi:serine protease
VKPKNLILRAGAWALPVSLAALVAAVSSSQTAAAQPTGNAPASQQPAPAATQLGAGAPTIAGAPYAPGTVVVGYRSTAKLALVHTVANSMGLRSEGAVGPGEQVLVLPPGETVSGAITRLRQTPGIAYAVPDYLASIAGSSTHQFFPNDPGRAGRSRGWESMQWNFLSTAGIDVPEAWANLRNDHRPGGKGVVVAIVDTGVAYRDWNRYRRSPDFTRTHFVHPHDFVADNRYPLDRVGHGTFVAGTVAESTNNRFGLTGIAYGASIMPVRVLNRDGYGTASNIARGIRYAVRHGAQVINLSVQFPIGVTGSRIPQIVSALRYAKKHRVVVVAAAGNESSSQVTYPARGPGVIAVGATTSDRCLARYSNMGPRVDLVAPGGGKDSANTGEANCHPGRKLPNIFQMTFPKQNRPRRFGYPSHWFGTSMASPEVAGVAALVIASRILGRHPTTDQVLQRLESTAQPLGGSQPNGNYGWGLVDAGAASARP